MYEGKSAISNPTRNEKQCFVIMPLGGTTKEHSKKYWDFFYRYIIAKALEEKPSTDPQHAWISYKCEQPKAGRANIMKDVVSKLMTAELVIAVLTDKNANVWYELGIRHALHLPTVMIMDEEEEIPFDINQYGLVTYSKSIINKSRFLPLIHYLSSPIRALKRRSHPKGSSEENNEDKLIPVYFDIYHREYRGQKGFSEKISVEEYEKFKEKLLFFSQDKQKRIDNPVMEFMDLPVVQLIARTDEITVGERLEVRAELSRKDCSRMKGVEGYFAVSDSEIAKLRQNYTQKTDDNGVMYGEIEGKGLGRTYVMVMARVTEKQIVYKHTEIKVRAKEQ